jgi:serine protease AprX
MSTTPKIHPVLAALLSQEMHVAEAGPLPAVPIIVKHKPFVETLAAAAAVGGVMAVSRQFSRAFSGSAMSATPEAIRVLAARPDIEMIWLDEEVHTLLDVSVPLIGAPSVWNAGFTGKGVRVGVVDTGIDSTHPDLVGRVLVSRDFTGEGEADNQGHGTHVAGIIGGTGAQSGGKYRGVAPECLFVASKVLKGDGTGMMSDVIAGLEFVAEQHVQVVNLSLGGGSNCDGSDALSVACDSLVDQGLVVCVAAGNSGPGAGSLGSPGCAKKVITIGATDKQDGIADYSSRGPSADGRVKPDVCFPGSSIHSCRAKNTSMGQPLNDYYTTASGTSMATPHATGSSALLLQAQPNSVPQEIKDALMNSAKDLGLDANTQGKGRVQLFAAFQSISTPHQPPQQPPTEPPAQPPTPEPSPTPAPLPSPSPLPTPEPAPPGGGCRDLVKSFMSGR